MDTEYKCQNLKCEKNAEFVCEIDDGLIYYHDCLKMHKKKHKNSFVHTQNLNQQQKSFLDEVLLKFKHFKSNLILASTKIIKNINDCTFKSIKELDKRKKSIMSNIRDSKDFNDLKRNFNQISLCFSNQINFDNINEQINRFLLIHNVYLIQENFFNYRDVKSKKQKVNKSESKESPFVIIIKFKKIEDRNLNKSVDYEYKSDLEGETKIEKNKNITQTFDKGDDFQSGSVI